MNRRKWIGWCVAGVSAVGGGCAERNVPPVPPVGNTTESETETASPARLDGAAVFECSSGETIQVRFNYDPPSATLRRGSGDTLDLPMETEAEMETYSSGHVTITVGPGDARFDADGESWECTGVSQPLEPPAIEGVTRALRQSDEGSVVELGVGDTFSIALVGVPTAGYQWATAALPDNLEEAGSRGGATSTAQFLPGFAGGNHWEVLAFRATAKGEGELVLEERRPFESPDEPAADAFRVSVLVK